MPDVEVSIDIKYNFIYKIISGGNQTFNDKDIVITANGELNKLTGIKVDGKLINEEDYILESGSTILTLKSSYLNTLSTGNHILTLVYNDGSIDTTFTIANSIADTTTTINPQTNDNIKYYVVLFITSIIGLSTIATYKIKQK